MSFSGKTGGAWRRKMSVVFSGNVYPQAELFSCMKTTRASWQNRREETHTLGEHYLRSIGDLVLLVMKTYSAGWLCSGLEWGAHKPSQAPMAVLGTLPGFFNMKGLESQTKIVGPAYRSIQMFEGKCRAEQSLFSMEDNGLQSEFNVVYRRYPRLNI